MAEFNLNATVTISIYTCVEAETPEQAIEIAKGRSIERSSNWDVAEQAKECWISDEFDGEPENIATE
jgi:hypothetical protein